MVNKVSLLMEHKEKLLEFMKSVNLFFSECENIQESNGFKSEMGNLWWPRADILGVGGKRRLVE